MGTQVAKIKMLLITESGCDFELQGCKRGLMVSRLEAKIQGEKLLRLALVGLLQ
jgi:hypothetical protein